MTKRIGMLIVTLAVAGLLRAPTATAATDLEHLRVGDSAQVAPPGMTLFPVGTPRVFVRFDYKAASNERINLVVQGQGGVGLFAQEKRYNGDGTETVEITGAAVYAYLAAGVLDGAQRGQEEARAAATHQRPQELLNIITYSLGRIDIALDYMQRANPGRAQVDQIKALRKAESDTLEVVTQAARLASDDPRLHDMIVKVGDDFTPIVNQATALKNGAGQVVNAIFPPTGTAKDVEHVAQLLVGDDHNPAASVVFQIARKSAIYTPVVVQKSPLGVR